jgi:branched-chain amino acid transport system permease protein
MDYVIHLVILVLLYSIVAISLNLLVGYTGLLSVGHAAFYGIGAFGSGLLAYYLGVHFLVGMLAGVVIAIIAGAIVSIPALRVKDEFLVLLTIGFNMVIFGFLVTQQDLTGGRWGKIGIPTLSFLGISLSTPAKALPVVILFFAICFAISWRLTHSPFGRVLKAMRDDETATRAFGKDILRFKVFVFILGAGLAAIAGSLWSHYNAYVEPRAFTVTESIFLLALVVIGGSANLWGSVLAAFLLITIPEILTFLPGAETGTVPISAVRVAIYGALMVIFMRFRPKGLLPEHLSFRNKDLAYVPLTMEEKDKILTSSEGIPYPEHSKDKPIPPLQIERLCKHFGGLKAVDDVSFVLPEGKITALIGPNGAGKTTIFNLITGFLSTDRGRVHLRGREITNQPPHKINHLGLVRSFQEVRIFRNMSVLDNVLVACGKQKGEDLGWLFFRPRKVAQEEKENRRVAKAYLDIVGLGEKAEILANDLAFAEQKLLMFACLLATRADVLLIDEVVSGIDPGAIDRFMLLVRQLANWGKTICIIEHNIEVVKSVADLAYFLSEGKVIAVGTPTELIANPKLTQIYFGV